MEENRKKALAAALGQIEKQFGKGSVMRLGDASAIYDVDVISTGSLGLDIALGVGGLPRGRIIEIYGPESSGKTTLTLQAIAEAQRAGGTAAFVDAEHALDPVYAEKLGVNVKDLLVSSRSQTRSSAPARWHLPDRPPDSSHSRCTSSYRYRSGLSGGCRQRVAPPRS